MKTAVHKRKKLIQEILGDAASIFFSAAAALLITQRGMLSLHILVHMAVYLCYAVPLIIAACTLFRVYRQMWQFVSVSGLMRIFTAVFFFMAAAVVFGNLTGTLFSFSFYFLNLFLIAFFMWAIRVRGNIKNKLKCYLDRLEALNGEAKEGRKNVLLVGAGQAAALLLQNYENTRWESPVRIVGMADDDKAKTGLVLHGVKVLGACADIPDIVARLHVEDIIVAIPSASPPELRRILGFCRQTKCRVRVIPHLDQRMGALKVEDLFSPSISDLIGRPEYRTDTRAISELIRGRRVMVTGGGGSIGSELCRQIMRFGPEKLVIVDIYENSTYDLYKELLDSYGLPGHSALEVRICSILNEPEMERLFERCKIDLVFHAAAYKHVPLMEICPKEAVRNNILGTYLLARMAVKFEVKKFLLVSTDKAVNPSSIMGATKRAAELIVRAMQGECKGTDFVAVRFGNVLGSNGSVVVQFKRQISTGGPVTVTHPDIIRYFMSISEAVSLVLQTMYFARGGELFVLDMGSPVKIDSLARRMIEIAGLRPDVDIKIAYTGLRPGEKLFEELLVEEEGILRTENEKIFVTHPKDVGMDFVHRMIGRLMNCIQSEENVKEVLKRYIETFRDEALPPRKPAAGGDYTEEVCE